MATTLRLHIAGITPSISPSDLQERFTRWGRVERVDAVGVDSFGQPRNFAYLTLHTTPQDYLKCLNTLQSSLWRGATLKISPAKPTWESRVFPSQSAAVAPSIPSASPQDQAKAERKAKLKRRRTRLQQVLKAGGKEGGDMRLVTTSNVAHRRYWTTTDPSLTESNPTSPPQAHLIRPIFTRPTHPLPASSLPSRPTTTTQAPKSPARATSKRGRRLPLRRAKRVWLDPGRWGGRHAVFGGEEEADEMGLEDGRWIWEEAEEGEDGDIQGQWVFRSYPRSGSMDTDSNSDAAQDLPTHTEPVRTTRARVQEILADLPSYERKTRDLILPRSAGWKEEREGTLRSVSVSSGEEEEDGMLWAGLEMGEETGESLFPVRDGVEGHSFGNERGGGTKQRVVVDMRRDLEEQEVEEEEEDNDDDGDDLFQQLPSPPLGGSASPLFPAPRSLPALPPSRSASASSSPSSDSEPSRAPSVALAMTELATPAVAVTAEDLEIARRERERGLEVLRGLGIDLDLGGEGDGPVGVVRFDEMEVDGDEDEDEDEEVEVEGDEHEDDSEDKGDEMDVDVDAGSPVEEIEEERHSDGKVPGEDEGEGAVPNLGTASASGSETEASQDEDSEASDKDQSSSANSSAASSSSSEEEEDGADTAASRSEDESGSESDSGSGSSSSDDEQVEEKGENSGGAEGNATEGDQNDDDEEEEDDDDDSDDDDENTDSEDSSDWDSESSSDEEEEDETERTEDGKDVEKERQGDAKAEKGKGKEKSLKDMFAPSATAETGFSLMANLDLELSDTELDPSPFPLASALAFVPAAEEQAVPLELLDTTTAAPQSFWDPDPSIPLFFPGAGLKRKAGDEGKGRSGKGSGSGAVGGHSEEPVGFFRQSTDEEMTKQWQEEKLELTREWKKRHREGVKRRRRGRGGMGEDEE